jgi:hypothetical protein
MEELSLQRIRDLIIAAHSVSEDGELIFDTTSMASLGFTKAEIDDFIKKAIIAEKIKDNFFDMDFSYIKKLPAETVAQHFKYYNDNNKVQDFNEDDIHRILFKYILESSDVFNKFSSNKFSSFLIKSGLSIEQFNREIFSPRILFASSTGQSFFNPSYIKLYNDSHDLKIYYTQTAHLV